MRPVLSPNFTQMRSQRSTVLLILALVLVASGPAAGQETARVLVLGTYHFDNPGLDVAQFTVADVLTPEKQAEIAAVVEALAAFRPTKVVVEQRPERAARLDSLYAAYRAGQHALGRSEVEQLGFRLAARFGHDRVHPADHGGEFPFGPLMAYAQEHEPDFVAAVWRTIARVEQHVDSLQRTASIGEILRSENRLDHLREGHAWYVSAASVGAGDGYAGADLLAAWYDRNIRIFANIASLTEPGDRVLVIFGAGHAPILRELIQASSEMELVEANDYL